MKWLLLSLLIIGNKAWSQVPPEEMRPATQKEIEALVDPLLLEEIKTAPEKIIISENDDLNMEELAKMAASDDLIHKKHLREDIKHFLQNKINQGATKDIVIYFSNIINSNFMGKLSITRPLEHDIDEKISKLRSEIAHQKDLSKEFLASKEAQIEELLAQSQNYQNILERGIDFQKLLENVVTELDFSKLGTTPADFPVSQKLQVGLMVPKDFNLEESQENFNCDCNSIDMPMDALSSDNNELMDIVQVDGRSKKGRLYFFWGYNRSWHTNSDVTFKTSEGEFTIHNAHGDDRPSTIHNIDDLLTYVRPADFTIPQFNFRIGYMFNKNWGIEGGTDHMKWIFDNQRQYEITGDFSPTLYVHNPDAQYGWDGVKPVDFDYVKEHGDATWLGFEHSDGYNYVHLSAVYNKNLFTGKRNKFAIEAGGTVGGGAMIPKTKVMMHRDEMWQWSGLDNRFHLAGYGGHVELSLKFKFFDRFALKTSVRGTAVKVQNALVYTDRDPDARLEHTPIYSLQVNAGLEIDLWKRK